MRKFMFMHKPRPLFMSTPADEVAKLFDLKDDDAGGGGGGGGDDKGKQAAAPPDPGLIPNDEWVPAELRGKPLKEALQVYNEVKQKITAAEEAAKKVQETAAEKDEFDINQFTLNQVLTNSVVQRTAGDAFLTKYNQEIVELLTNIRDPRIRTSPEAFKMAVAQVRGAHYDEALEMSRKSVQTTPVGHETTIVADGHIPRVQFEANSELAKNLAAFFEGDLTAARKNLLGEDWGKKS